MNFKKLVLIAVAAISLVSCKDDDTDIILFSKPNVSFPKAGGEMQVGIDCKEAWSVTIPKESWIESVNPMNGTGSATLTITAKKNTSGTRRTTEIYLNSQSLLMIQEIGGDVDPKKLYGIWETDAKDFKFTFNEDMTCKAEMDKMGIYDGTYALNGNLVTISINDSPKKVIVTIDDINTEQLVATVNNKTLLLKKL